MSTFGDDVEASIAVNICIWIILISAEGQLTVKAARNCPSGLGTQISARSNSINTLISIIKLRMVVAADCRRQEQWSLEGDRRDRESALEP
jgi:hypothetical protein